MAMKSSKDVVAALLALADIEIGGADPHDIRVQDNRLFDRILSRGSLGFGDAYVDGWWDSEALDETMARILRARLNSKVRKDWRTLLYILKSRMVNLQSLSRAFQIGERHYDIGNDLYTRMLGDSMAYTCAYWKKASTLDEAQRAKFDLICRKTGLKPGMRVLELGCGWGAFARYAATNYGVEVTACTVSREQAAFGRELCRGLHVDIRMEDYRSQTGEYDVVLSIGLMEHVGYKNYRTYMETAHRCLKPGGIAFIHTIGGNRNGTTIDPWIGAYIFPNAVIPSLPQLTSSMHGLFILEDCHNIGPDYDLTLLAWHRNFENHWPELSKRYTERFRRIWRYYLLSCAGGFRARYNQLWQIVMTLESDGRPIPDCRHA